MSSSTDITHSSSSAKQDFIDICKNQLKDIKSKVEDAIKGSLKKEEEPSNSSKVLQRFQTSGVNKNKQYRFGPENSEALYYPTLIKKNKSVDYSAKVTELFDSTLEQCAEKIYETFRASHPEFGLKEHDNEEANIKKMEEMLDTINKTEKKNAKKTHTKEVPIEEKYKMKSLEAEILGKQVSEYKVVIDKMRKGYFKEIQNLRELFDRKPDQDEVQEVLNVRFFSVTDGLEKDMVDMLNERLSQVKALCEQKIQEMIRYTYSLNDTITKYKALKPQSYQMMEMPMDEIFKSIGIVERNPRIIWDSICNVYSDDFFTDIIEIEYAALFAAKDPDLMFKELEKIKLEAKELMSQIASQSKKEIQMLRREMDLKNQEIQSLKERQVQFFDKIGDEAIVAAENKVRESQSHTFKKWDEEKAELYKQIKQAENLSKGTEGIIAGYKLKYAIFKWSVLSKLKKIAKAAGAEQVLELEKLENLILESNKKEFAKIEEEYKETISFLKDEISKLTLDKAEFAYNNFNYRQKIEYLQNETKNTRQECQNLKENTFSLNEQNRKLEAENKSLKTNNEHSKKFILILEKDKKRLEEEASRGYPKNKPKFSRTNTAVQHHRALHEINDVNLFAVNTLYNESLRTKGVMTDLKDLSYPLVIEKPSEIAPPKPVTSKGIQTNNVRIIGEGEKIVKGDDSVRSSVNRQENRKSQERIKEKEDKGEKDRVVIVGRSSRQSEDFTNQEKKEDPKAERRQKISVNNSRKSVKMDSTTATTHRKHVGGSTDIQADLDDQKDGLSIVTPEGNTPMAEKYDHRSLDSPQASPLQRYESLSPGRRSEAEEVLPKISVVPGANKDAFVSKYLMKNLNIGSENDKDIKVDQSLFQRALDVFKTRRIKDKRSISPDTMERLYPKNQPEVYKRLWGDAKEKGERADELSAFFKIVRAQEWYRTLSSSNYICKDDLLFDLHKDPLTGKQFVYYDELLERFDTHDLSKSHLSGADGLIHDIPRAKTDPNGDIFANSPMNGMDLLKLYETNNEFGETTFRNIHPPKLRSVKTQTEISFNMLYDLCHRSITERKGSTSRKSPNPSLTGNFPKKKTPRTMWSDRKVDVVGALPAQIRPPHSRHSTNSSLSKIRFQGRPDQSFSSNTDADNSISKMVDQNLGKIFSGPSSNILSNIQFSSYQQNNTFDSNLYKSDFVEGSKSTRTQDMGVSPIRVANQYSQNKFKRPDTAFDTFNSSFMNDTKERKLEVVLSKRHLGDDDWRYSNNNSVLGNPSAYMLSSGTGSDHFERAKKKMN